MQQVLPVSDDIDLDLGSSQRHYEEAIRAVNNFVLGIFHRLQESESKWNVLSSA